MDAYKEQARVAAVLEKNMGVLETNAVREGTLNLKGLEGYTLLKKGYMTGENADVSTLKAVVVQDPEGNIYVHYRGTGDGFWPYNSVAYGPVDGKTTSPVQDWAVAFFDQLVSEREVPGQLYVTGHSQGGNNAQFVTLRARNSDMITSCVELDGQGFSHQFVEETMSGLGSAEYKKRCDKIYAYNGDSDYVSCLGQERVMSEDHIGYLKSTRPGSFGDYFTSFHASEYLTDEYGNLIGDAEPSPFRELALAMNEQVLKLPQDEQEAMARTVMKLCENFIGGEGEPYKAPISEEDLQDLKYLSPVLIAVLEERPELLTDVLTDFGVDQSVVALAETLVTNLNELPVDIRQEAINGLIDGIVVNEDGGFELDWTRIDADGLIEVALPVIMETIQEHPEQVADVLHSTGLDTWIIQQVEEHPALAVTATLALSALFAAWDKDPEGVIKFLETVVSIVQKVEKAITAVKNFVVNVFTAIKKSVGALVEWFKEHSAGARYAEDNPYIKADTTLLRQYADRLAAVNTRLWNLDGDLNTVYWQVGLLDVWDLLTADFLTSWSLRLSRVRSYLTQAADKLEAAERKAKGYMEG